MKLKKKNFDIQIQRSVSSQFKCLFRLICKTEPIIFIVVLLKIGNTDINIVVQSDELILLRKKKFLNYPFFPTTPLAKINRDLKYPAERGLRASKFGTLGNTG